MRWSIRMVGVSACALAVGCGVSASGMGLNPEFAKEARVAYRYLESHVIPEIPNARFAQVLAESRAKVKGAQSKVSNNAERGVWLLLTMVNVKANETRGIEELSRTTPSAASQSAWREVVAERTQCMTELHGWLSGDESKLPALERSPCLQTARQAAAVLGR